MKEIINILSLIASFAVVFTVLFVAQEYTIGLLPIIKRNLILRKYFMKELFFSVISLLLILAFIQFVKPYN